MSDERKTRWFEYEQLDNGFHKVTYTTEAKGSTSAMGASIPQALRNLANYLEGDGDSE